MDLKDLKLNKFGEFLYPIEGVHGGEKTTIWVYDDDPFKHKIRVSLVQKKITVKKLGDIVVNASKYIQEW